MKPPFAYYGGKSTVARAIAGMLPPHRNYIEPFAGSLAVLFAKTPSVNEIVNDVDGDIVAFFRVLRDRPEDLERACRLTPYARAEYADAGSDAVVDDLERARRFWVRVNQSFSKTAGARTGWSRTVARTQSPPASVLGRIDRFAVCAERLMRVSIECTDAVDLIEQMGTADTVIYCDPPYLASTRSSRSGWVATPSGADYRHDMGSADDHLRLAAALTATPAAVLLSGYPSPLYDDLYHGWHRTEWATRAASSNATRSGRGARTEVIWSNRPLPVQLSIPTITETVR